MVMRPEPWGEALDAVISAADDRPTLVFPTPSGRRFDQRTAQRLAQAARLVFAAGRYEGIDQRVVDHYAGAVDVEELSLGDYVLNGGEAATLAMIEAVVRLLPGVVGNPESLTEESHAADMGPGLLEYPVYTKPPVWRGHAVPEVLMSGHHDQIAQWRREQAVRRTAERRPDLLATHALAGVEDLRPQPAVPADAPELWTLQRACWVAEAQANDTLDIPALTEGLADVTSGIRDWRTWIVRSDARLIASVRGRLVDTTWQVGRLMVAPDLEGRGIGRALLAFAEAQAPDRAERVELLTGARSRDNLRMYRKAGYRPVGGGEEPGVTRLTKPLRGR
jgi:tRNA (guanine37-N1)-methyltransferase